MQWRGVAKVQLAHHVQSGLVLFVHVIGRAMKSHNQPGLRGGIPFDVFIHLPFGGRFLRDIHGIITAFPAAPVFFGQLEGFFRVYVAGHNQDGLFGAIPAIKKLQSIIHLVGHVFDVAVKAHGGVLVRVHLKGLVAHHFEHFADRVGAVFQVFALHRQGFGTKFRLGEFQVLETVGLQLEDGLQVSLGGSDVVVGVIVCGVGVLIGTGVFKDFPVFVAGVIFSAVKHHVLEEMGKPRFTRLHFIARTGLHGYLHRDHVRVIGGHHNHAQAIGQVFDMVFLCKDLVLLFCLRMGFLSRVRATGTSAQA